MTTGGFTNWRSLKRSTKWVHVIRGPLREHLWDGAPPGELEQHVKEDAKVLEDWKTLVKRFLAQFIALWSRTAGGRDGSFPPSSSRRSPRPDRLTPDGLPGP
jgi:hypothetical protein